MEDKTQIKTQDLLRIYKLLEEVNDLFHQPLKYKNAEAVEKFAESHYPEIRDLYYEVVWNYLPPKIQQNLEER